MSERLGLPDDFRDLLVALADEGADFVLVGGWAVAVHGRPRATDDLDVLVRADGDNAARVYRALVRFGAPVQQHGLTPRLFEAPGYGYRFGLPPQKVEVLTSISGVGFDAAMQEHLTVEIDGRGVPVIGRAALIANKKAAGRLKDLDDVQWLEAHPPRTGPEPT